MSRVRNVPTWAWWCGLGAMAATLPTVVWRVIVGAGIPLGTPASWRAKEALPGSGTSYVIGLSVAELVAAALTLVLIVPRIGRWFPAWLVILGASVGTAALALVCALSIVNWHKVDPFGEADRVTGWTLLCWACYAVALAWPVLLAATITGYARASRSGAAG